MKKNIGMHLQLLMPSLKNFVDEQELATNAFTECYLTLQQLKKNHIIHELTAFSQYPNVDSILLRKIFGIINLQVPSCILHEELCTEFWRFYSQVDYGQLIPGQRVNRTAKESQLCVILQGTVDIEFGNNFEFFNSNSNHTKNNGKKRNNRISHFAGLNDDDFKPVGQINSLYNIRAVTTGYYLKFPKKLYQEFKQWLKLQQRDALVKFLSFNLDITVDDVRLFRIHKKIQKKQLQQGYKLDFNAKDTRNFYLLVKGQILLTYKQAQLPSYHKIRYITDETSFIEQDQFRSIYVNDGAIFNNAHLKYQQNKLQYKTGEVTKKSTLIVLTQSVLNQLIENYKRFAQKIYKQIKKSQIARYRFCHKQSTLLVEKGREGRSTAIDKTSVKNPRPCIHSGKIKNKQNSVIQPPEQVEFQSFSKGICLVRNGKRRFSRKSNYKITLTEQHQQFFSIYPYMKIAESQEKVFKSKSFTQKKSKSTVEKIGNYLKQSQMKQKSQNKRILMLKLRKMATKSISNDKRFSGQMNETPCFLKKGLFDCDNDQKSTYQSSGDKQLLLARNDMGLINQFTNGNRVYQKELAYLLHATFKKAKGNDNKENATCSEFANIFSNPTIKEIMRNQCTKQVNDASPQNRISSIFYNRLITQANQSQASTSPKFKSEQTRERTIMRRAASGKIIKVKLRQNH